MSKEKKKPAKKHKPKTKPDADQPALPLGGNTSPDAPAADECPKVDDSFREPDPAPEVRAPYVVPAQIELPLPVHPDWPAHDHDDIGDIVPKVIEPEPSIDPLPAPLTLTHCHVAVWDLPW